MIGQSRFQSWVESTTQTVVGYLVALGGQYYAYPRWFHVYPTLHDQLSIGLFFLVLSLIRQQSLRRLFNFWHVRSANIRSSDIEVAPRNTEHRRGTWWPVR